MIGHRHRTQPTGNNPITRSPTARPSPPDRAPTQPRALTTHGRLTRIHTKRDQHITEVQAPGTHTDTNLPRPKRLPSLRTGHEREILERSPSARMQTPLRNTRGSRQDHHQSPPVRAGGPTHHHSVSPAAAHPGPARPPTPRKRTSESSLIIDVDEHEPLGVLRLRLAHQTPHRRLSQARHILPRTHSDSASGDQHQTRIREALIRQPLLHQGKRPPDTPVGQARLAPGYSRSHEGHSPRAPCQGAALPRQAPHPEPSDPHTPQPSQPHPGTSASSESSAPNTTQLTDKATAEVIETAVQSIVNSESRCRTTSSTQLRLPRPHAPPASRPRRPTYPASSATSKEIASSPAGETRPARRTHLRHRAPRH